MLLRRDRTMTAVLIMLDVAFNAGRAGTVSAADIAERAGLARRGIEPLLQSLSRSALLESVRGPRGGYQSAASQFDDFLGRGGKFSQLDLEDSGDAPRPPAESRHPAGSSAPTAGGAHGVGLSLQQIKESRGVGRVIPDSRNYHGIF